MSFRHRSSSRRRRKPNDYQAMPASNAEERLLQHAIERSKVDRCREKLIVPFGPVFYPSQEDFEGNPMDYIDSIRPIAEKYGICKIVPPDGWNPPFCVDMNSTKEFQTKEQQLKRLQEGISFDDGEDYCPKNYVKMANEFSAEWLDKRYPEESKDNSKQAREPSKQPSSVHDQKGCNISAHGNVTPDDLECDYWDAVETSTEDVIVEYGNDIDTEQYWSGFPLSERGRSANEKSTKEKINLPEPKFGTEDYYKETWWNLNNIANSPNCILRHVKVGITGINVPWLYFGSLFSTFCWHNEDNYMPSINYHHKGAPKLWYGVPGTRKDAEGLERVFRNYLSSKMRDVPDLLHHITTMVNPQLLQHGGVPVCKILQYPGEYVVTFPRAFHGGFSLGPNIGEAVNFATHDWISAGADASERYRTFSRVSVFSHDRLAFIMANNVSEEKCYTNCCLLLKEVQRVVDEELRSRKKLIDLGVRDLSEEIKLPANRCDQLDSESADYDDKRLCHSCKHICFFSAVACECSQSKVSCLRHSHSMCRCPTQKRYLLVWSPQKEMTNTLETVKNHCNILKAKGHSDNGTFRNDIDFPSFESSCDSIPQLIESNVLETAPGVQKDLQKHKHEAIQFSLDLSAIAKATTKYRTSTKKLPEDHLQTNPRTSKKMKLSNLSDFSDNKKVSVLSCRMAPKQPTDYNSNLKINGSLCDDVVYIGTRPPSCITSSEHVNRSSQKKQ